MGKKLRWKMKKDGSGLKTYFDGVLRLGVGDELEIGKDVSEERAAELRSAYPEQCFEVGVTDSGAEVVTEQKGEECPG